MTQKSRPFLTPRTLRQLRWVFDYYATHHLEVRLKPRKLVSTDGQMIGYLEDIALRQGRLYLRGWSLASEIHVRLGDFGLVRHPHLDRRDVADALGCDPRCGFEASLPLPPPEARPSDRELTLSAAHEDATVSLKMRLPGRMRALRAKTTLAGQFLRDCMVNAPDILQGLRQNDPALRRRIKAALRLDGVAAPGLLNPDVFAAPSEDSGALAARPPAQICDGITIILPVFNAFALLAETLQRVRRHTDLSWHLIVIEDGSTDARVRPFLQQLCAAHQAAADAGCGVTGQITLLENDANLGFIRSVNRGFDLAHELDPDAVRPVILLNSDAFVPEGWASRLVAPLVNDPDIASVTPMSNDAEILSVPVICTRGQLEPGQGDALDTAARTMPQAHHLAALPTGVGFCMAMSPVWLRRVGVFDTGFGKGYGEEVDWCRRAADIGARHLATAALFVEHRGGESFGAALKQAALARNNAMISTRYPGYDALVQGFILGDPLLSQRMALALEWMNSHPDLPEIPVYVAHSMGGGAEMYLQNQLLRRDPQGAVLLRMGGTNRVHVELHTTQGRVAADCDTLDLAVVLISRLARRKVIYSCAVGDPDLSEIPAFLCALAGSGTDGADQGRPLEILFHDYLPISPSYTLLDSDGQYRGVPPAGHLDPAHRYIRRDGTRLDLAAWRACWQKALSRAEALVVFSPDSEAIVAAALPDLQHKIRLRPHKMIQQIERVPNADRLRRRDRPVIGVLGNINLQKGAGVLVELAKDLRRRGSGLANTRLVVVGRVDPNFELSGKGVVVHGPYEPADLPLLIRRYGITCWLIPSIWPETFSFTTHECLATGLPVMAFGLGAQGAAVSVAENGHVIAWPDHDTRTAQALAQAASREFRQIWQGSKNVVADM